MSRATYPSKWPTARFHGTRQWRRDDSHTPTALETLDATLPAGHLAPAAEARDLPALARAFDAIPQVDWVWIDFHIGVRLVKATGDDATWTPDDVWRRACDPWRTWLR